MKSIIAFITLFITTFVAAQTTPLRNPQIQGAGGAIVSGATLTNSGTFSGAGTFNFASGTVTMPATQILTNVTLNGTITFADNIKQTFNPGSTNVGINVGGYAGVPSSLVNGDLWYDSTANALKARINGATVSLGAGGGGSGTPGGNDTEVQFNNAEAFGGITNATTDGTTLSMTSPAITTSITTPSTTFTAFAGATTLLTLGGTGATATLVIPGTEAANGSAGTGALSVAGGGYFGKDVWIDGLYIGDGANSGSLSVVIGKGAHGSATTATTNIAIGNNALAASTNSSNNVAIGTRALEDIETGGGRNTAVGTLAGTHITGGLTPNTTSSNSIYIGNGTRAFADGDTNEIVIGHSLTGEGSNTTTIGNSSTTAAHIYGALTAVGTGLTGTASGLTAGNVTTNANLTGHVTSTGNAAVLGSFTAAQLSTAVSDDNPAYVGAANTFTTIQLIDGGADALQLVVKGHSTQTVPIFTVERDDGTDRFTVADDGSVTALSVMKAGIFQSLAGNVPIWTSGQLIADLGYRCKFLSPLAIDSSEAISGTGAVASIYYSLSRYTSTAGGQTMDLAAGEDGWIKFITHVSDGGDCTLNPTVAATLGWTSINFAAVGDSVTLQYFASTGWIILAVYGATVTP